ncbi:MAG TPA: prenyltransferase/squalene oxidase repeat-containing protein, partial [Gemmataceae bacterium]|nr:prenyltransferase/squalene oxidase repeat-containing protein [Gemmataceae bacterium]
MVERLLSAFQAALFALLAERGSAGHWTGELSTSALSTATAVSALALVQKHGHTPGAYDGEIANGLAWLARHQNVDGGWGDTTKSISNTSTSMLCQAAFHLAGLANNYSDSLNKLAGYLQKHCGHTPAAQADAIRARYGKDRTFAVPILTTAALAGLMPWDEVSRLPFELACVPQSWYRFLRLHVVSYALPALIAIGIAIEQHRPSRNPIARLIRQRAKNSSLRVLEQIQPSNGGFLEATPLTSFVTLSLASADLADHPVARKGADFLVQSVRPDGSWPIDTNLATWVTTLSINALAAASELEAMDGKAEVTRWLLAQQYRTWHPYTGASPGAWAWTDLPGGVPDADDTPGALLALLHLASGADTGSAVVAGVRWLLDLQNRDGGWPTFCRGWGRLPFDRSGADLTAHALRALAACQEKYSEGGLGDEYWPATRIARAIARGFAYLARCQRSDGSWLPLWFGNQHGMDDTNPTYGTARVLAAYRHLDMMNTDAARRGVAWLLAAQNADGGWGGAAGIASSMEETALAVEVLLDAGPTSAPAVGRGLAWLVERVEAGGLAEPTPIGFYFARLWYFERLYPIIFTVA